MRPGEDCCRPQREPGARLWDAFPFSGDWQMLQLRLGTLSPFFDQFVVLQGNMTFGGDPRVPAALTAPELAPWRRCVRLATLRAARPGAAATVQVQAPGPGGGALQAEHAAGSWPLLAGVNVGRDDVELWARDQAHFALLPLPGANDSGLHHAEWLHFSDLDELPEPRVVRWLTAVSSSRARWYVLQLREYAYGLWNQRHAPKGKVGVHMVYGGSLVRGYEALRYRLSALYVHGRRGGATDTCRSRDFRRQFEQVKRNASLLYPTRWPSQERILESGCQWMVLRTHPRIVYGAGWHCTNCFPTAAHVLRKLCSFGWMLDLLHGRGHGSAEGMLQLMREGRVVHSTSSKHMEAVYDRVDAETVAPAFLRLHRERFAYLLDPARLQLGSWGGCPGRPMPPRTAQPSAAPSASAPL